MKRGKLLLISAMLSLAGNAVAQDSGELIDLLPDGVTANINPERKWDKQKNLVVAGSPEKGYKAFFAASDSEHGEELWVTDGTKEGTHMVADIIPGSNSSEPCYISRFNDKVLFSAYTDDYGRETYISDGTEEGTILLADTYILGDGNPKAFIQMDEHHAVFAATDDESAEYDIGRGPQQWLWITDGTPEGTYRLYDCDMRWPGQDNTTLHTAYVRVGRRVFFKADNKNGTTGEELWVTDGTPEGTYCVMDINWERYGEGQAGYEEGYTRNAGLDNLENYNNERVFFQAWTPDYGSEPWTSDGLVAEGLNGPGESGTEHTYMIYDAHEGKNDGGIGYSSSTFGTGWEVYKDRIWFRGWNPNMGYEFAGTNMQKGDYQIYDIFTRQPSQDNNSFPDPGCIFDGVYMFCASEGFDAALGQTGGELHYFDGEKVVLQYDFCTGTLCDWVKEQTVAGGSLYWMNEANDVSAGYGTGLYRLDSKDGVPVVCTHIVPTGDFVHSLRNLGGTICFASDATKKVYVYKYTKPGWDGVSDMGYLEPEYRTPAEIAAGTDAIKDINAKDESVVNVYTLDGVQLRHNVDADKATEGLAKGVYVVGTKKVVVR